MYNSGLFIWARDIAEARVRQSLANIGLKKGPSKLLIFQKGFGDIVEWIDSHFLGLDNFSEMEDEVKRVSPGMQKTFFPLLKFLD